MVYRCRRLRKDPGERSAADRCKRIGGGEDADVAERAEHEQIAIAGDDERGLGAERGGEHEIIIGIAADGFRKQGRHDDLGEARVVLHQVGGGEFGSVNARSRARLMSRRGGP